MTELEARWTPPPRPLHIIRDELHALLVDLAALRAECGFAGSESFLAAFAIARLRAATVAAEYAATVGAQK